MKLIEAIKAFFVRGFYDFEIRIHISSRVGNKEEVIAKTESVDRLEKYNDYTCDKIWISREPDTIEFYLTENDEDF